MYGCIFHSFSVKYIFLQCFLHPKVSSTTWPTAADRRWSVDHSFRNTVIEELIKRLIQEATVQKNEFGFCLKNSVSITNIRRLRKLLLFALRIIRKS
jgi:hypothetical protein